MTPSNSLHKLTIHDQPPNSLDTIQHLRHIQSVPGEKVNILGGHGISHSKQKTLNEHVSYSERFPTYSHLNVNCKIVDKKEILRVHTVPNTGIYCPSDGVGTVYNKCSKIPGSSSVQLTLHTDLHASDCGAAGREGRTTLGAQAKPPYSQIALSQKPFRLGHMVI
jgi:hypothetical protein